MALSNMHGQGVPPGPPGSLRTDCDDATGLHCCSELLAHWARENCYRTCVQYANVSMYIVHVWSKKSFRSAPKKTVGRVTVNAKIFFQCAALFHYYLLDH